MKFFALAATFFAAASALALPERRWGCIHQRRAEHLVDEYISILVHSDIAAANATGQALLADDYSETSDSILSLEGQPLGGSTFVGRDAYLASVLNAPPVLGINTIEVLVAGCHKILWYWVFTGIGTGQYEVKGFNLFTVNEFFQFEAANLEFNSIAWALDTGYQVIFPPPPS